MWDKADRGHFGPIRPGRRGKAFSATGVARGGEICGKNAGAKRLGPAQSGIKLAICRVFEGRSRRHDGGRWDWPPRPKPDRRGGDRRGGKMGSDPGPALGERLGRLGRGQAALFQEHEGQAAELLPVVAGDDGLLVSLGYGHRIGPGPVRTV